MVFSSAIFLFAFLPAVLVTYLLTPYRLKNLVLLAASIFFYAWGELFYCLLMLVSITGNYTIGRCIESSARHKKYILAGGVALNLFLLGFFKYTNFIVDSLNYLAGFFAPVSLIVPQIHLPLGISFFTFQAISYIVDVYRKETPAQKNYLNLGLYISLFPQLIAGPIVRYNTIADQLVRRNISLAGLDAGITRFIYGLAKKMLIANPLGEVADSLFALPPDQVPSTIALAAVIFYALQIYFDFSGYSDMAIGLGRIFGFNFPENFNYPYIARSVREFWQRWHISLTTWFRDYLYIPMGGSRVEPRRLYFNLFTVFVLCGLWHGASWNFLIWGLWHGMFLVLERTPQGGEWLRRSPSLLRHAYTLSVVFFGWVFFRTENIGAALAFIQGIFGSNGLTSHIYPLQLYVSNEAMIALFIGIIFSMPVLHKLKQFSPFHPAVYETVRVSTMTVLLVISILKVSSGTYNPFIYFRF
ncbi:MAG: MBOAT family protein [Desulfobulbaceae bacterium]|nr:MBOAT family protein [Desulfobulbaceae bacterium]